MVGNGLTTRLWEDVWLGDRPFALQYPRLYHIVQRKDVSVASVMGQVPLNVAFRRSLAGVKWTDWIHLVTRLMTTNLTDEVEWKRTASGVFTVKSMYLDLINDGKPFHRKIICKMKIPLKIKIFMWFLDRQVILTKDNPKRRIWQGCTKCCFCGDEESIQHLFLHCWLAKILWRSVHIAFNLSPPSSSMNSKTG